MDYYRDDLAMICDMFYLPFEHGSKAQYVLSEFQWLKINSHVMDHTKLSTSPELHLVSVEYIYHSFQIYLVVFWDFILISSAYHGKKGATGYYFLKL